jgi:hypothetical protein
MGTAARGSAADHCLRAKEAIREMLALNPCRNVMIAALQSWPHNRREAGEISHAVTRHLNDWLEVQAHHVERAPRI